MKEIRIPTKDAGQRLDKYLKKLLPQAGSSFLYKMLRKKNITLNDKKAEGREVLQAEDVIKVFFSDETYARFSGTDAGNNAADTGTDKTALITEGSREAGVSNAVKAGEAPEGSRQQRVKKAFRAYKELKGIRMIRETADLLFVFKPVGILSQGDHSGELSLNDWIYGYALEKGICRAEDAFVPGVSNRLDRNTSGLVMAGLTYAGSRFLSNEIRDRHIRKFYHATAEGRILQGGEIRGYLIKDRGTNMVRILPEPEKGALPVHTVYTILGYHEGYTELEAELVTGRSHQLRAHFSSLGHPLAGDIKYGGHPYHGQRVQQLSCVRLEFPHYTDDPFGLSELSVSLT